MQKKYRARDILLASLNAQSVVFWSLIAINWLRKPPIRKTLLTKCVPSGFTALNWSGAEQRGPWIKRSRRRVCSNSCLAVSHLQSLHISKKKNPHRSQMCSSLSFSDISHGRDDCLWLLHKRVYNVHPQSRGTGVFPNLQFSHDPYLY